MPKSSDILGPSVRVSLMAGPIFGLLVLLFELPANVGVPISFGWSDIGGLLAFALIAIPVGLTVALPVCMVAARSLLKLGNHSFLFRPMVSWIAVAAALSLVFCQAAFGFIDASGVYALCGTAMGCAAYIHRHLDWA